MSKDKTVGDVKTTICEVCGESQDRTCNQFSNRREVFCPKLNKALRQLGEMIGGAFDEGGFTLDNVKEVIIGKLNLPKDLMFLRVLLKPIP